MLRRFAYTASLARRILLPVAPTIRFGNVAVDLCRPQHLHRMVAVIPPVRHYFAEPRVLVETDLFQTAIGLRIQIGRRIMRMRPVPAGRLEGALPVEPG